MRTTILGAALLLTALLVPNRAARAGESLDDMPFNLRAIAPEKTCPRAMWVWSSLKLLTEGPEGRDRFFDFCKARRINRLYLCANSPAFFEDPVRSRLRAFIARAHAAGIEVDAMDGWPEAAASEEGHKHFIASLTRILDYNDSVEPAERFDGFQSDVEPHALRPAPETDEARRELNDSYVRLHQRCKKLIEERAPENFVFGMAISGWLDGDNSANKLVRDGKEVPLLDVLADFCDYWAVMAYRDTSEGVLWMTEGERETAARRGVRLWIGQEVGGPHTGEGDPPTIHHWDEGLDHMEREIAKTVEAIAGNPSFAGFAIHHYDSYLKLPDGPRPADGN